VNGGAALLSRHTEQLGECTRNIPFGNEFIAATREGLEGMWKTKLSRIITGIIAPQAVSSSDMEHRRQAYF
jgi:hypothetical protein